MSFAETDSGFRAQADLGKLLYVNSHTCGVRHDADKPRRHLGAERWESNTVPKCHSWVCLLGASAGHCGPCDPIPLSQCCSGPQSSWLHLQRRAKGPRVSPPLELCCTLNVKWSVLSLVQSCPEVHTSKTLEEVRPEGKASRMEVVQGADCAIEHPR